MSLYHFTKIFIHEQIRFFPFCFFGLGGHFSSYTHDMTCKQLRCFVTKCSKLPTRFWKGKSLFTLGEMWKTRLRLGVGNPSEWINKECGIGYWGGGGWVGWEGSWASVVLRQTLPQNITQKRNSVTPGPRLYWLINNTTKIFKPVSKWASRT